MPLLTHHQKRRAYRLHQLLPLSKPLHFTNTVFSHTIAYRQCRLPHCHCTSPMQPSPTPLSPSLLHFIDATFFPASIAIIHHHHLELHAQELRRCRSHCRLVVATFPMPTTRRHRHHQSCAAHRWRWQKKALETPTPLLFLINRGLQAIYRLFDPQNGP